MEEDLEDNSGVFGSSLGSETQFALKLFSASPDIFTIVPKADLILLLNFISNYVQNKTFNRQQYYSVRENVHKHWKKSQIMLQLNLTSQDFDRIFSGLMKLFQNLKNFVDKKKIDEEFGSLKTSVQQQIRVPEELLNLIFERLFDHQTGQRKICTIPKVYGNMILAIKWRLDVIVADLSLSKVLRPIIKFEFHYTNSEDQSQTKTLRFDCTIEQFHRFRFMTTCALRELNRLQNKLCLS